MELSKKNEEKQSIRHFNDQKVDQKTIEDILNYAVVMTPLDKGERPWRFVVVENQELKEKIADMLFRSSKDKNSVEVTCNAIKDCSVLILVFVSFVYIDDKSLNLKLGASFLNSMVSRPRDLGLTSLWIKDIRWIEKELRREFFIIENFFGAVALGYSDHFPSKKLGKNLEEVSDWY